MKKLLLAIVLLVVLASSLTGCSSEVATSEFLVGLGAGLVATANKVNEVTAETNAKMKTVIEGTDKMEADYAAFAAEVGDDPIALLGIIDPNLAIGVNEFMVNAEGLAAKAEEFRDEKGKIDPERIGWLLATLFGGGSLVNIFKNWSAKRKP